ncbi:putative YqaJ-like viral recombinase domain containing protein [Trypanosoma cruzi]|nr:putative YqaJ-like viral recombinase domain containing protein [Trypanosoma cruzi]
MAQHPKKLQWKEGFPFGLSASQFGMALGFCGRVVDFVDYLRNVVGTELEFKCNASTVHGNKTEPKARALYELLTGTAVSDGGFFVTDDRLLGCSPDGRIFYDVNLSLPSSSDCVKSYIEHTSPDTPVSVPIPFCSKWSRQGKRTVAPARVPTQRACRLLEIKSPYYSLYDGSKPEYQPFGIPLHYLCQMQGQMAIANADECDFFVYLDRCVCQVVAWRVRRSSEFWKWAKPKLLQVVEWVRDGPPASLDRRFEFEAFDFDKIVVEPLIFPYDITANLPILDARRFPFFQRHPNPYLGTACGTNQEGILRGLTSAVTRFLFHVNVDENPVGTKNKHHNDDAVIWCRSTDSVVYGAALALSWNAVAVARSPIIGKKLAVVRPHDFNDDRIICRIYASEEKQEGNDYDTIYVHFFQRDFFHSLEPLECARGFESASGVGYGGNGVAGYVNLPMSERH